MDRQSTQVLRLAESSLEVEASVDVVGPIAGRKLDRTVAPRFENREDGCQPPRFLDTMVALKEELGDSREHLVEADRRHVEQLRQIVELREERQELVPALYSKVSKARQGVEGVFGTGKSFVIAGVGGATGQTSGKLLSQAQQLIDRFHQPGLRLPKPEVEGFKMEPTTVADDLKVMVDRLSTVLAEQRRLRREAQETRKVKNRLLKEHKDRFVNTARTLEGLYRLAGEEEHADRIRPSLRRRGQRVVDVEGEAAEGSSAAESAASGSESVPAESTSPASAEAAGSEPAESAAQEPTASEPAS